MKHRVPSAVWVALAVLSHAAVAATPARRSIAVLGVGGGGGYDAKAIALIEELVVGALDATGRLRVTSRGDVESLIGFEKKKQALGCQESSACLSEIVGALGVDLLAVPTVGKLGSASVVAIKVVDVRTANAVARSQRSLASDAELPDAIVALVGEVVATLDRAGVLPAVAPPASGASVAAGPLAASAAASRPIPTAAPATGAASPAAAGAAPTAASTASASVAAAPASTASATETATAAVAAAAPLPSPIRLADRRDDAPPRWKPAARWSLAGLAAAALACGTVLNVQANYVAENAHATRFDEARAYIGPRRTGALAAFGVATAAAIAAAAWWALERRTEPAGAGDSGATGQGDGSLGPGGAGAAESSGRSLR